MSEDNKQHGNHVIDSVFLWLIFGIFAVITPPALVIIYEKILGDNFTYIEYTPDVLLVILSLCCNLMNLFVDRQKRIYRTLRWLFGIVLTLTSFMCWGLFIMVRFDLMSFNDVVLEKIYISSLVVMVGCAIIGSIVEAVSNGETEKKDGKNE